MKLFFTIIFTINYSFAINRKEQEAINNIQKAVLKYSTVNKAKKKLEKRVMNIIPLDKKTITAVGTVLTIAKEQKINTRQIKNMNLKILKGNLRPNISHDFKNSETFGSLDFSLSW